MGGLRCGVEVLHHQEVELLHRLKEIGLVDPGVRRIGGNDPQRLDFTIRYLLQNSMVGQAVLLRNDLFRDSEDLGCGAPVLGVGEVAQCVQGGTDRLVALIHPHGPVDGNRLPLVDVAHESFHVRDGNAGLFGGALQGEFGNVGFQLIDIVLVDPVAANELVDHGVEKREVGLWIERQMDIRGGGGGHALPGVAVAVDHAHSELAEGPEEGHLLLRDLPRAQEGRRLATVLV